MAWNDVKYDDNAVHILVLIGGHSYKFNQTDIKVERKIGDTLNKFSLGVVDDGSDDYIEFERIVTSRFVNIEIHYGNSSSNMSKWQGFVADYQPVFLGPTTKLTVTGYISRKQTGLPDQTSPYLYYIDWAPVIGKRKDSTKDWDDIYNGNFSFTSDSFGNKLKDVNIPASAESIAFIESLNNQRDSYVNSNAPALAQQVLTTIRSHKDDYELSSILGTYVDDNGAIHTSIPVKAWFSKDPATGKYDISGIWLINQYQLDHYYYHTDDITDENWITDPDRSPDVNIYSAETLARWAPILGQDLITKLTTFNETVQKYDNALANLDMINDTYGDVTTQTYGLGHVPWDFEIMSKYEGNIEFSKFSHPKDSKRSIARVIPDLFVKWDKDIPIAGEYLDKDGQPRSGNWEIFPEDAINDIKVFGLQYVYNSQTYLENPGNPYKAFILLERDIHGVKRVYEAGGNYYIWVGDCPELYKKWEQTGWSYSSKNTDGTDIFLGASNVVGSTAITDYSGANGTFKPRLVQPEDGNKYYITTGSGGWSTCIYGEYSTGGCHPSLTALPNCVGYAAGRFHEIMGSGKFTYPDFNCNAEGFVRVAESHGLQVLQSPTLGGIMVWSKGDEYNGDDGAGHVAIVEEIKDANTITISQSGWHMTGGVFSTQEIKSPGPWSYGSGYKFLGCIVNPAIGTVSDGSDIITNKPTQTGISNDEAAKWGIYEKGKDYDVNYYLQYEKSKYGVTEKKFKASDWDADIINGNIRTLSKKEFDIYHIYGQGRKTYVISGLAANADKGIKAKTAKQRIEDYLKATYRSASPINYGVVYISDIVAQLCILEGWKNPIIRTTAPVSYKSDFLSMDGMGALEYITQKLCPNATEDSSSRRTGFTAFFDKNGIFHFEPIDANGANVGTILTIGYNVQNTNIISFTVRSRGQVLMLGVNETYEGVDSLTGATISVTQNKNEMTMSETEKLLANGSTAQFFNLALYNYYGYDKNSNTEYQTFTSKLYEKGGIDSTMPYGTSLIRRSYESSISSSTQAAIKAFNDLTQLQNTSIKAELTMLGDNTIEPGKYIQIINYSRKGFHYTSGKYYVKSMTDSVNIGQGFTQSLELCRFSSSVPAMNTTPEDAKKVQVGITTKLDTATDYIKNHGLTNFDKWYEDNINIDKPEEETEKTLTHTFDCNGGYTMIDGKSTSVFKVVVKPGEFIPEPDCKLYHNYKSNGVNLPATYYEFEYWYLASEGEKVKFDFSKYVVACDATFKAKWKTSSSTTSNTIY